MSKYFSDQLQELQENAASSGLAFRREALATFRAYGLPRRKQDPWKYVNNSALFNIPYAEENAASPKIAEQVAVQSAVSVPETQLPLLDLIFCNDTFSVQSCGLEGPGWRLHQLELAELEASAAQWQLDSESLSAEENSYSLINAFSFSQAYELQLDSGSAAQALTLRLRFTGQQSYQAPRLYIKIPEGTEVRILLDTRELGSELYWNPYFFFDVAARARLTLLERGPNLSEANHVRSVTLRARVAEAAYLNSALFYWGTELAVHDARFAICGKNAELQVRGICFGEARSAYHLRCENQHLAPNSSSNCLYKNVLFGKASSEFYGIIHADNNGVGTNAEQQNRNLLLSEEARAIARPQLEILIDDLKCSHGSSTGSIDAEELFYMRTRGLNQGEAMHLAIVGFVEEISTYFAAELLDALGIEDCLQALLSRRK